MNPILASEGLRRMRSWRTPILLSIFGGLMLLFCYWWQLAPLTQSTIRLHTMNTGVMGYVVLMVVEFGLILLIAPIMSAGSIAGERERQTLDLLLVTNTGSLKIVLGKLLESFGFLALLIIGMTPISCSVLLYGSVDLLRIGTMTLFMLISAFAALSVGMMCSVLFKRTVTAAIVSYLVLLGIGLLTLIPLLFIRIDEKTAESIANGAVNLPMLLKIVPAPVWINPGLGLAATLISQTGIMQTAMERMMPMGYEMSQLLSQVGFELFAWVNMGAMLALSILLIAVAAIFVRPRSIRRRAKPSGKHA